MMCELIFSAPVGCVSGDGFCSDGGQYRLWGNNWENAVEDKPEGNVYVDGVAATRSRGIDVGGNISEAPFPEPGAALLF